MAAEIDDIVLEWSLLPETVDKAAGDASTVTKAAGASESVDKAAGINATTED